MSASSPVSMDYNSDEGPRVALTKAMGCNPPARQHDRRHTGEWPTLVRSGPGTSKGPRERDAAATVPLVSSGLGCLGRSL